MTKNLSLYKFERLVIYSIIVTYICFIPIDVDSMKAMSILLLLVTIDNLMIFWNKGNIIIFLLLLCVSNISLIYGCFIFYEENASIWQLDIINTNEHFLSARLAVIWYIMFAMGLLVSLGQYQSNRIIKIDKQAFVRWRIGTPTFFLGFFAITLILIFGIERSTEEYIAGATAIYEYAVLFFLIIWMIMPNKKRYRYMMILYAIIYILQGIVYGDRSSSFPMIILLYILLAKEIKTYMLMLYSVLGIFGANLIGLYRTTFEMSSSIFQTVANRLLYVDSVGYSFYAGVQIVRSSTYIINEKMDIFYAWLSSLIWGTKALGEYNLPKYIQTVSTSFANGGGGMVFSYFYFWFGILGVIISGVISGLIISKIFSKNTQYFSFIQLVLIIYTLRWYVYGPSVLFRTCMILPSFLYLLMKFWDRVFIANTKR